MLRLYGHGVTPKIEDVSEQAVRVKLGSLIKTFLVVAIIIVTTSIEPDIVLADDNAPLKKGGFQLTAGTADTIRIKVSADATEAEFESQEVELFLHGKMDFRYGSGYAERAGLFSGKCKTTSCGLYQKLLWFQSIGTYTVPVPPESLPGNDWNINLRIVVSPQDLLGPSGQVSVLNWCKQNPTKSGVQKATVTLSVNTRTNPPQFRQDFDVIDPTDLADIEFNGGDQSRHADFWVLVDCFQLSAQTTPKAPKTSDNQDLNFDHGSMKVKDVRLTFATFQNSYTEPNPGTRCKKARLRVRLETNQKGFASFKLWQQRGDGAISNKDYIIGSHHDGNGRFFAQKDFEIRVYETTKVKANAKELISATFQQESGWRDITLHCSGAGGGGLANPTNNDDDSTSVEPMKGGFGFVDNSKEAKQNKCERTAKALIWLEGPKNENFHYSLDCGALGNFSGVLSPTSIGNSRYRAGKVVNLPIKETIEAGCTLRTVSPGAPADHAFESKLFQCVKPAGHDSGIGGVVVPTRPQTNTDGTAILPDVCKGGKIRYGVCTCPNGTKLTQIAESQFSCKIDGIVSPAKPTIKTAPIRTNPPKTQVSVCKGGKIRNNKCKCPANANRKKISRFEYICQKKKRVKPAKIQKKKAVRTNPKLKKRKLVCIGGKIRRDQCKCGKNKIRKKRGKHKFQCIAVAKPLKKKKSGLRKPNTRKKQSKRVNVKPRKKALVCRGGTVRGNRCKCPRGYGRKRRGKNNFLCFRRSG